MKHLRVALTIAPSRDRRKFDPASESALFGDFGGRVSFYHGRSESFCAISTHTVQLFQF
jgi:hypothetical protein